MKKLGLLIALTLLCSACAPSTTLRSFFTGKPSNANTISLLETVINRSGGTVFTCPAVLVADNDPHFNHLCAQVPTANFNEFSSTFESNLNRTASETNAVVERLYDGWKRSNNYVFTGFFALNGRTFNVVFGPNEDGKTGGVVMEVDQRN